MADAWTIATVIAAIALVANLAQRIFGAGASMPKALAAVEARLTKAIDGSKREIEDRQDAHARDTDAKVNGVWDHVRQVELHLRDHYVRRDDFAEMLRVNFSSITSRLDRIEKSLDNKGGHH
jgi:hypothetical protein